MKRIFITFIFMFAAISIFAQAVVNVSGTVLNTSNGTPVPSHVVYIFADSTMNTNGFYYNNQVFTDANGFYNDVIPIDSLPSGYYTSGTLQVRVYDCNNWHFDNSVFFSPGMYNLTADFNICAAVISNCSASFYASADSAINTVDFTDYSSGNINSWLWDFGDGTNSTLQSPIHTYTGSGYFNVCLTISELDSNNAVICTDTYCENTAVGICTANFSANSDTTNTVAFYNYSSGYINSWFWNFGDGTSSTLQAPTHTYSNSGYFNVCLTISHIANGITICTDTYCENVSVNIPSTPDYFCDADFYYNQSAPGTFDFTDYSFANQDGIDAIVSWTWSFGDGTTSNIQAPSHTYWLPGVYNVSLTINTAEGCSSYLEMAIEADTIASGSCHADFEVYIDYSLPLTFYFEEASLFEDPNQVITSYSWDFGDGTTSIVQSPSHTFTQGVYHICHTITTTTGCSSTYCENLVVDSACYLYVYATAIVNESTVGAHNGAIALTVVGTPPFVFNWSNGTTTQNIYGLSSGYYNVWVTDANGCQSWATFDILVNADSLNWNYNDTLVSNAIDTCFNFQPASASIYSYSFQGNNTTTITWIVFDITGTLHGFATTTYLYDSAGYYYVLLSLTCNGTKNNHKFYDKIHIRGHLTGIPQTNISDANVSLFPVPAADKLNISFTLPNPATITINILNVTGQVIHSENAIYNGGQKVLTLNTSSLSGGLYFVELKYNGQNLMRRFV